MGGKIIIDMVKVLENTFNQYVQSLFLIKQKSVKRFRSDGGEEYLRNNLPEWLKNRVITHKLTTGNSPDSNGGAEGLNRTF